ncbi:hypothetical protein [Mangrovimonas sp. TPBH4]|uniref:hypothetical protein n=1 Tax=Mangrovimonas sp. TPBH4 TaxID=1645914 RepID=UPI0006B68D6C|nr:hypothetical protein [Mangrovimonas sp. TPBH4]
MLRELSYQSFPSGFSVLGSHPNHPWLVSPYAVITQIKQPSQLLQMLFTNGFDTLQNHASSTIKKLLKSNYNTIKYILL